MLREMIEIWPRRHSYLVSLVDIRNPTVTVVEDVELIVEVTDEGRSNIIEFPAGRI
jgi:hypothetical protein